MDLFFQTDFLNFKVNLAYISRLKHWPAGVSNLFTSIHSRKTRTQTCTSMLITRLCQFYLHILRYENKNNYFDSCNSFLNFLLEITVEDEPNTPENNFKVFWNDFDKYLLPSFKSGISIGIQYTMYIHH
jgi:hypothetical protein